MRNKGREEVRETASFGVQGEGGYQEKRFFGEQGEGGYQEKRFFEEQGEEGIKGGYDMWIIDMLRRTVKDNI